MTQLRDEADVAIGITEWLTSNEFSLELGNGVGWCCWLVVLEINGWLTVDNGFEL